MSLKGIGGNQVQQNTGKGAKQKRECADEEPSPRGVLERPPSCLDPGRSSSSIGSSRRFRGDKSLAKRGNPWDITYGSVQFKKFIGQIKKMPSTKFGLGGSMSDLSIRSLRKKLSRNHCTEEESIGCDGFVVPKPSWRKFTFDELKKATRNFSSANLIGKGGHAEVYKGFLPDGQAVAVKKIIKNVSANEDRVGGFLAELGIIAHIDHPNSAKLIGFSADPDMHLILKYCSHGSLASALHGSKQSMKWKMRYKVALGIAEGLKYLHFDCQRRIVHRDITASNILLCDDYEPQISDFGLAKWLPEKWSQHVVSPIEGTFGYMAPEYFMHGIVNEKIDVFSFGVLLLELITGRRSVDSRRQNLVMWAKPHLEKNNIKEIVDPRLREDYNITEMKRAMFAASMCIHHSPSMRPNMNRILQLLRGEREPMADMKQKSTGMKSLLWDNCDVEDYTCATYINDLNRHKELVME